MKQVLLNKSFSTLKKKIEKSLLWAVLITLCINTELWSQSGPTLEWTKTYAGEQENGKTSNISSWVEISDGYLIAGSSNAETGLQKSESSRGDFDYWIVKTDKNGNKIWDKTFGGSGTETLGEVIATSDGGFLLAGTSNSPKSGDKTEASRGEVDFWVIKITGDGTKQWDKTYGGERNDVFVQVVLSPDDGYLLGGTSDSDSGGEKSENTRALPNEEREYYDNEDYWIVKISQSGVKQWDKTYGGGGYGFYSHGKDILIDLLATPDGGYLLGGNSYSIPGYEMSENSDAWREGVFPDNNNYWIIKVNSEGAQLWDKVFGGEDDSYEFLRKMLPTPEGGFLLAGESQAGVSGNKTVAPVKNSYNRTPRHVYLIKISDSGMKDWERAIEPNTNDAYDSDLFNHIALSPGATGFYLFADANYRADVSSYLMKLDWNGIEEYKYGMKSNNNFNPGFFKVNALEEPFVGYLNPTDATIEGQKGYIVSKYTPIIPSNVPRFELSIPSFINFTETISIKASTFNVSSIIKMEFYDNGEKIGEDTTKPYGFTWEGADSGVHHIFANAIDNTGKVFHSSTLPVTVFANPVILQKAINLNGSAITIDNISFESSGETSNFTYHARAYANQNITLNPTTDDAHSKLIRSSYYGTALNPATYTVNNIPDDRYEVYLYTWEDNFSSTYSIAIEGKTVLSQYKSGAKGTWKKIGPFIADVTDGNIQIKTTGGDANISSIEIWKVKREIYRAINVGSSQPSLIIDGLDFKGGNLFDFSYNGKAYENQSISLVPSTDTNRAKMIRSCIYSTKTSPASFTIGNVPNSLYDVYLYVWEDNRASTFSIKINNTLVLTNYNSGSKGTWKKLGPYRVEQPTAGRMTIEAYGGDANISGIEIWSVDPVSTTPASSSLAAARIAPMEVENKDSTGFIVYPNSFNDKVNVVFPSTTTGKVQVLLINQYGQVQSKIIRNLDNGKELQLNLPSGLSSGIYFLKLKTEEGERVIRLSKE